MPLTDAMSNIIGSVLGLGGSLGSTIIASSGSRGSQARAYNYQRLLQQQQYDLQQQGLREGYTNARQGLESAGLNPILAATNGFSYPSVSMGGVGTDSPSVPDFGNSITNSYRAFKLEKQQVNNQTAQTEATINQSNAQAELQKEQAITEQAKRTQMEFQNAMYDVEKHLKEKELSWADRKFYSEIYDNMQRAENYGAMASIARYNAQTERMNQATNAMNADTNLLNAKTNIGRTVAGIIGALGVGGAGAYLGKAKYLKGAKQFLGKNGYSSSLAKYFTTLH